MRLDEDAGSLFELELLQDEQELCLFVVDETRFELEIERFELPAFRRKKRVRRYRVRSGRPCTSSAYATCSSSCTRWTYGWSRAPAILPVPLG
jgi:hypothetical protein